MFNKPSDVIPKVFNAIFLTLSLTLVILRIFGAIEWEWIWVISPVWTMGGMCMISETLHTLQDW